MKPRPRRTLRLTAALQYRLALVDFATAQAETPADDAAVQARKLELADAVLAAAGPGRRRRLSAIGHPTMAVAAIRRSTARRRA